MVKKYFWKVTTKGLKSITMSEQFANKKLILQYQLNKWIYPKIKNTKCLVFNTKERAIRFIRNGRYGSLLFKCEVKNPKVIISIIRFDRCKITYVKKFWDKKTDILPLTSAPTNTYSCDAVKLIKEVK